MTEYIHRPAHTTKVFKEPFQITRYSQEGHIVPKVMKSWLIPRAIVTTYLCAFTQLFEGILGAGPGQALSALRQQEGSVGVERRPFVAFGGILSQHRCQIWPGLRVNLRISNATPALIYVAFNKHTSLTNLVPSPQDHI